MIQENGLWCESERKNRDITIVDISKRNLKESRSTIHIHVKNCGTIHNYVPFYFNGRSPIFIRSIKRTFQLIPGHKMILFNSHLQFNQLSMVI
ncbi:MAG: DUF4433 domain-containing protein [Methanospirillaceae archaeon]|nr:DUF4433 domain-containing protein [Methanospirillaceae archaeon]